jgi:hypothetical protein
LLLGLSEAFAFSSSSSLQRINSRRISDSRFPVIHASDGEAETEVEVPKQSLEEKMKGWEASEEEIKAASLGGMVPGKSDGFDIGLAIAFPIIVGTSLLFAVFPFIMDKIDVSSVGPPPMV